MLSPRTTALIHVTRMKALNKRPPPWLLVLWESLCPPLRAPAGSGAEGGEVQADARSDKQRGRENKIPNVFTLR